MRSETTSPHKIFFTVVGLCNGELTHYQPLVHRLCGKSGRKCHVPGKLGESCTTEVGHHQNTILWKGGETEKNNNYCKLLLQ